VIGISRSLAACAGNAVQLAGLGIITAKVVKVGDIVVGTGGEVRQIVFFAKVPRLLVIRESI